MGIKSLLGSTDYSAGTDNRFKNAVVIGKVSELVVNEKGVNVRVIMPDKVDHQGQPLITKPIPVGQVSAGGKRSFACPRLGQNCILVKLPNGMADYLLLGTFYTSKDPPPVTDPKLDYVVYDEGSTMQFDANNGTLTWRLKGQIDIQAEQDIKIKGNAKITIDGDSDVLIKSATKVTIDGASQLNLIGTTVNIQGNIVHTGNMTTSGIHQDANGFHVSGRASEERMT